MFLYSKTVFDPVTSMKCAFLFNFSKLNLYSLVAFPFLYITIDNTFTLYVFLSVLSQLKLEREEEEERQKKEAEEERKKKSKKKDESQGLTVYRQGIGKYINSAAT